MCWVAGLLGRIFVPPRICSTERALVSSVERLIPWMSWADAFSPCGTCVLISANDKAVYLDDSEHELRGNGM